MPSPVATADDRRWMKIAIELAHTCLPAEGAYSVGAVIVGADGQEISRGYSREIDPKAHAEESALAKLTGDHSRLLGSTIYSTLEPCSQRASRPLTCTQLILAAGIKRVVVAWREPSLFVANCQGVEFLEQAGVTVIEIPELGDLAQEPNKHLAIDQ